MSGIGEPMSTLESESKRRATRRYGVVTLVVGLAAALVLSTTIALAWKMVAAGRGLEIQTSFWLVDDNCIGYLFSMGVCVFAVVIGLVWRALQQRRDARAWQEHAARWAADRRPDL